MADSTPVQADDAGALDMNKLPEMQQQLIPEGGDKKPDDDVEVADADELPDEDPQMGVATDNG